MKTKDLSYVIKIDCKPFYLLEEGSIFQPVDYDLDDKGLKKINDELYHRLAYGENCTPTLSEFKCLVRKI